MRRCRGGFILLFGTRAMVSEDRSSPPVPAVCPRCGQRTNLVAKTYRNWFTLFFIPLFPISAARRFSECAQCGGQFAADPRELGAQAASADREQHQRAIALYNSLRNSPANSITLNELMSLYASAGDYDAAIGAARDFPAALEASEQCMTTLARVHLARNDWPGALRWLDAALARNPSLAEAHYFKGVAHLTSSPPDFDRAVAAARAARSNGYPAAEELLREAEARARGG